MANDRKPTSDEAMGIAWWNSLDAQERMRWMEAAGNTGVAADAWAAFKKNVDAEIQQVGVDRPNLDAFMNRTLSIGRKAGN